MWVFKSLVRNSYLATNPKVMGSTLLQQSTLSRFNSKERYIHFLLKEITDNLGPEYVMLVRNPYLRVESYFREKLRQKVKRVYANENPYTLKRHQEIFYPFLGIKDEDSLEFKVSTLLNFTFKDYVSRIPFVYKLEDHLAPQTYNFSRHFLGSFRTMKMNKYIRVENKAEMEWLANHFQLDFSIRVNDTSNVEEKIEWDDACKAIVQDVYKDDFTTFRYNPAFPGDFLT